MTEPAFAVPRSVMAALRATLRECAEDLQEEIDARCPKPEDGRGAAAQRRYERDSAVVARALDLADHLDRAFGGFPE